MLFYTYEFSGTIQKHSMGFNKRGELFYNVLFVPEEIRSQLPLKKYPRLRINGEMHDIPIEAALQPAKGRSYLLISQAFMKEHGLKLGDEVEVRFNIGDQDFVDVPTELQRAIDDNKAAQAKWESFSAGKKRGFATMVASAKREATRVTRSQKMIAYILADKNPGGRDY